MPSNNKPTAIEVDAQIDEKGNLFLKRGNHYKQQLCSRTHPSKILRIARSDNESLERISCGDWCPLFVEHNGNVYIQCSTSIISDVTFVMKEDKRE